MEDFVPDTGYTGTYVRKKERGEEIELVWSGGNGLLIGASIIDEETEVAEIYMHDYLCKWNDGSTHGRIHCYVYIYTYTS